MVEADLDEDIAAGNGLYAAGVASSSSCPNSDTGIGSKQDPSPKQASCVSAIFVATGSVIIGIPADCTIATRFLARIQV